MIPSDITAATLQAIRNTISLYCLALDTHDFELLSDVFTEDMTANYEAVSPANSQIKGLSMLIDKLNGILDGKTTQHALSTQILDFDPLERSILESWKSKYECRAITYFTANTFVGANEKDGKCDHVTVLGRYEDRLMENEDGEWRIVERTVKTFHPRIQNNTTIA